MPITFKLVGNIKSKLLKIKYDINGIVRFSSIISIFKNYGVPPENFEHIKVIIESEPLNNDSKFYQVSDNSNLIVFIFTSKKDINDNLIEIFSKHNIDDTEANKIEEKIPELSQDIINSNNIKTLQLFENPNFKQLLKIYFNEPEIFKTFLKFYFTFLYPYNLTYYAKITGSYPKFYGNSEFKGIIMTSLLIKKI